MDSGTSDNDLTIFKNVAAIIATTEFATANQDFYNMHAHKFDAKDDENKHEYMQLFENYVSLNDQVLEAKLLEDYGYTKEDMKAFYDTFQDNRKRYEEEDACAFDTLFTIINFDAFKKQMFAAKTGMIDVDSKSSNAADKNTYSNMDINEEWKLYQSYMAEDLTDKKIGWKKKVE